MRSPNCNPSRALSAPNDGGMLTGRTVASAFRPFRAPCVSKYEAYSPFTPAGGRSYSSPTPESIERSGGSMLTPPLLRRPFAKTDVGGSRPAPESVLLEINSGSSLLNPKARRALDDEFRFEAGDGRSASPRLDGGFVLTLPSVSHSSSGIPGGGEDGGEEDDMPEMPSPIRLPFRAMRARSSIAPRAAVRSSERDSFVPIHPRDEGGQGGDGRNEH